MLVYAPLKKVYSSAYYIEIDMTNIITKNKYLSPEFIPKETILIIVQSNPNMLSTECLPQKDMM